VTPEGETALRRGLPRVAGGEPWPPATATRAAVAAKTVTEPVAAPAVAEPAAAVAVAEPVAVVPARDVSIPLPFPRTAWAGRNAFARPAPTPEPKRYGPFTKGQWAGAVIVGGAALLFAAAMAVLFVRWFLSLEFMQEFLTAYPGEYPLPEGAPVGMPPWLGWQHFFNVFLMVLIIRSGLQVRTEKRPSVFWSPRSNGKRKISLNLWFHQSLDILWIVNGVIFIVLLFATGMWMKIVPTSWAVFPNAVSAALQYVSLDWPTENGWVNYNSLQQLAYFATVFLAAPLAIATGVRMSGVWPKNAKGLNKAYPVEWARAVHFPVMLYFVAFIIVHVALVFATGALRNLNHMYASTDAVNWVGFWIFVASMVVIAAAWVAARPLVLAPIARLFGKVSGR
jgi:thiosulfate reductase cytochrome b subunit